MTTHPLTLHATPLKPVLCDRIKTLPVLVRVGAGPLEAARPHLTLAIAMDTSGSMEGARLVALRVGVEILLAGLRDDDEVVMVSFSDTATNQLARCPVSLARVVAPTLLGRLKARGNTALADGWSQAAQQIRKDADFGRLCRVVMLTDGQANKGITDVAELAERAAELAARGVSTTTIGLGTGFNEDLLQAMADRGLGSGLFAERAEDLAPTFESELELLNQLVVREARLCVTGVDGAECLNGYTREDSGAWVLPGIAADTEAWALLELPMDALIDAQRNGRPVQLRLKATQVSVWDRPQLELTLPPMPEVSEAQWSTTFEDSTVARRSQELGMAQLQMAMRTFLASGDRAGAEQTLDAMARLAEGHEWLRAMVDESRAMLMRSDAALEKELAYQSSKLRKRMMMEEAQFLERLERDGRLPGYLQEKRREGRSD